MRIFPKLQYGVSLLILFFPVLIAAAQTPALRAGNAAPVVSEWTSTHEQHVFGLPGAKTKESGTLTIDGSDLIFVVKTSRSSIRLQSVYAVGAGNERVELWGMKGRLLRMATPTAEVCLRLHSCTIASICSQSSSVTKMAGYHAAVFFLPANEAERTLQTLTTAPIAHYEPADTACNGGPVKLSTIRILLPAWNDADVPAAYRALVYEHLIERMRQSPGIDRVYRDGEPGCPQYTVQLTATGFKAGSQIARASTGPVGMFVGTTQMGFAVRVLDTHGQELDRDQIKATIRGESESINVSQTVAKKVAKELIASLKHTQRK
jgi:hypothetical protein